MTDYLAVLSFTDDSDAYKALSDLRGSVVANEVSAAAIVARDADGKISIPDGVDGASGSGFAAGSLIGMLVGVLGGPLGMLLGWGVGAATGSLVDADRSDDQDSAVLALARGIAPGRNALVLQTSEDSEQALDDFAAAQGATITRRPLDDVLAEVEAEEEAAEEARDAANAKLREQRKAERKENREERIAKLKAKFEH